MLFQILINAFSLGSFYALVALGFSLIFGITNAFNLAHGEMVLLSGYLAFALGKYFNVSFLATLPICMFSLVFVALLFHKLLRWVGEPFELNTLVATFGLSLVLQNLMLISFSADSHLIRDSIPPLEFPGIHLIVTNAQIALIALSLLATVFLHFIFRKTFLGKALRATIQDREAARLAGIQVESMGLIAFGIGGLFIGLAGPLYARVAYLHPSGGIEATLIAIIITIFAGVGRIRPILFGGWILGLVESATIIVLGTSWRELISAVLLISLLLLMPEGLLTWRAKAAR